MKYPKWIRPSLSKKFKIFTFCPKFPISSIYLCLRISKQLFFLEERDMEKMDRIKEKIALTADDLLPRLPKTALIIYLLSVIIGITLSILPFSLI